MKRCKDCNWLIEINFESAVGNFCTRNTETRWWKDGEAETCEIYNRKWWKFWRPR